MSSHALRIAYGLLSVPFAGFTLFGSVFLFANRVSPHDVLSLYAVALVAALLAMAAADLWNRLELWQGVLALALMAAGLMIAVPLLYWLFVIVPLWLFG